MNHITALMRALPPRVRLAVYAVLALAAIVVAGLQMYDGDWLQFAAFVLGALGFGTAASNVDTRE